MEIGTVTFDGSTITFALDSIGAADVIAGDVVTVVAPTPQDSTLADVAITLLATRKA
ncbi:MAG TPA: hypothetical protein VGA18_06000 [Rhodothermales bacterium]